MSKAPAFQFYVRDWLSDPELQGTCAATRGIWINALCFMWEAHERGKLIGAPEILARLLNCTIDEFNRFLNDARLSRFADVATTGNGHVTLVNRRMERESRTRNLQRNRVRRHRSKNQTRTGNAPCNADVTISEPASMAREPAENGHARKRKNTRCNADVTVEKDHSTTGKDSHFEKCNADVTHLSSSSSSSSKDKTLRPKPRKSFEPESLPYKLAALHLALIQERDPKAKANLQSWAGDYDKLIRLDGRDPEEVEAVLRWSQQDSFEQNVILSPGKLRQRYTGLIGKMRAPPPGPKGFKLGQI